MSNIKFIRTDFQTVKFNLNWKKHTYYSCD